MSNSYNNLGTYGRTASSVSLGRTRNTIGSINRAFNRCNQSSSNLNMSLNCTFSTNYFSNINNRFPDPTPPTPDPPTPPTPPTPDVIFRYTFYNSNNVSDLSTYIPIKSSDGKITYTFTTSFNQQTLLTTVIVKCYLSSDFFTSGTTDGLTFYTSNSNIVNFYNSNSPSTITITQFGDIPLSTIGSQFKNLNGIIINALDAPTILPNTSLANAFYNCQLFNSPLDSWVTTNVTNLSNMFYFCYAFSQDLSSWDTSSVTDMSYMFQGAVGFNTDVSSWNTSNVTNMNSMFKQTYIFNNNNQPLVTNGSKWDVSSVTDMTSMFEVALQFNQDLSSWDVSSIDLTINGLDNIFTNASSFNNGQGAGGTTQALGSGWASVTNYPNLWRENSPLTDQNAYPVYLPTTTGVLRFTTYSTNSQEITNNIPIITTDNQISITNVFVFVNMGMSPPTQVDVSFSYLTSFLDNPTPNDGLSFNNQSMIDFYNTNGITIIDFNVIPLSRSGNQFKTLSNISWDETSAGYPTITLNTSLENAFYNCQNFNSEVNSWDTSNVINMNSMFQGASTFDKTLNSWDTSNVINMNSMFEGAAAFNKDLIPNGNIWNTSKVTNMSGMFKDAIIFNGNISSWNTSKVTTMHSMFRGASLFDKSLSTNGSIWDVSKVTTMQSMFQSSSAFNQNLSSWNLPLLTNINDIFTDALFFNNGQGSGGTTQALGSGWTSVTNYPNPYKTNSSLTPANAYPIDTSTLYTTGTLIFDTFSTNSQDITSNIPIIVTDNQIIITNVSVTRNTSLPIPTSTVNVDFKYLTTFLTIPTANDGLSFNNSNLITFYNTYGITISQFDGIPLSRAGYQFATLTNFGWPDIGSGSPTITPNTSLYRAFAACTNFNSSFDSWLQMSNVTNMDLMFYNATTFNRDIGFWDVTNVGTMQYAFYQASAFNKVLTAWNLESINQTTGIVGLFTGATIFNNGQSAGGTTQPLGSRWARLSNYHDTGTWRQGSALTEQNASPVPYT